MVTLEKKKSKSKLTLDTVKPSLLSVFGRLTIVLNDLHRIRQLSFRSNVTRIIELTELLQTVCKSLSVSNVGHVMMSGITVGERTPPRAEIGEGASTG